MTKCVKSSVRDESGKVSKLHHFTVMQPLKPGFMSLHHAMVGNINVCVLKCAGNSPVCVKIF